MLKQMSTLAGVVLTATLAACSGSGTPGILTPIDAAPQIATAPVPHLTTTHVQLVIFENTSYTSIIGNPSAPYMNELAKTWANMVHSYAVTHPSQPNYLALFSGSTQGIIDDSCPHTFSASSLGGELLKAHLTFKGYAESMPKKGYQGCYAVPDSLPSGYLYYRKHVPWTDFTDVPRSHSRIYPGPLSSAPESFTWITPNMCNDMHDCSIAIGDKWASKNLPKLIAWDQSNDGVLILTFDENDGTAGNQIVTILAGNVRPGQYKQKITHYSVLRTIEDIFGLTPLGESASAKPIRNVIK